MKTLDKDQRKWIKVSLSVDINLVICIFDTFQFPAFDTQLKSCDTFETSGSVYGNLPKPELNEQNENDDGVTPDFVMTEDGVKLTDLGREQVGYSHSVAVYIVAAPIH